LWHLADSFSQRPNVCFRAKADTGQTSGLKTQADPVEQRKPQAFSGKIKPKEVKL